MTIHLHCKIKNQTDEIKKIYVFSSRFTRCNDTNEYNL